MSLIKPEKDLKNLLLNVLMPGRYVGGEFGSIRDYNPSNLNFGICFPDLYEIAMSNQAIKLLYRGLNNLEGITCERVFAPAKDFEEKLKSNNIPLYTLENGIPLNELDILGFSIGYELSATNILTILETGKIPILKTDRSDKDPVVIAGGPAITNPAPFGEFLDAVYIGEAEKDFYDLMKLLSIAKKKGADKEYILKTLTQSPNIWTNTKTSTVRRSIWQGFNSKLSGLIPISSISTVQDNGIVEIMRGCPNSCRFCHAASFYRPYRQKNIDHIMDEVDFLVNKCGYNEITLSSLSSGDYKDLDILIKSLNAQHVSNNISFSLPSLRINSFTLPLLKELSRVRRSGLTFAIETPDEKWRKSINKEVDSEKIISILKEAKGMGWKLAKFYFMIGLPGTDRSTEAERISLYIDEIQKKTGMKLNVNVGTFIPKAHTPFQWSAQLKEVEAYKDMRNLKHYFRKNSNVKLSYHSPMVSFVEGVISRGDKRVGDIILNAYRAGARLDAWEEHFDMNIWKNAIENANWNVEEELTRERNLDEIFPWDGITLGITKPYLKKEYKKALNYETTDICDDPCTHNCGICNNETTIEKNNNKERNFDIAVPENPKENNNNLESFTYLLEFSKKGKAIFLSHLNILNVFSKTLRRSGVEIKYTQGFNPKPKIEFAHPLSLGIESEVEVFSLTLNSEVKPEDLLSGINKNLPSGIAINRCELFISNVSNRKKKSLMSLYGGSSYLISSTSVNKDFFDMMLQYNIDRKEYQNLEIGEYDDKLKLVIKNTGRKDSNIFFHIENIIDRAEFNKNYLIERTQLFAGMNGKNYFDFLITQV